MSDAADRAGRPKLAAPGWRNVLWGLGALAVAAAVYEGVEEASRSKYLPAGQAAPEFSLERYEGGTLSLSQLHGKVVMLDFWATWCGPCVAEMPSLYKLAKEYESKGVVLVAANKDSARSAIEAFVTRTVPGLGPDVVFADELTSAKYRVQVLPTLYFIDREGRVVDVVEGSQLEFILRHRLEEALASKAK